MRYGYTDIKRVIALVFILLAFSCGKKTSHVANTLNGVETAKSVAMETIEAAYLYRARDLKARKDSGELTADQAQEKLDQLNAKLDQAAKVLEKVQEAEKILAGTAELYRANPNDPTLGQQLNELIAQVLALSQELYQSIDQMRGES